MKKVLAVVLALMLLLASAALAEPAKIIDFTDASVTVEMQGQTVRYNLDGLDITLALGLAGDVPTVQLDAVAAGDNVLAAVIQFIDGRMVLDVDGLSRPIAADMSAAGSTGADPQAILEEAFASITENSETKLGLIPGIPIPKIDLMSIAAQFGAQPAPDANGVQMASFSLPYEVVKLLLSQVGSLTAQLPAETTAQFGPVLDAIDQMIATDSGFALEGKVGDDGESTEMLVDVYPVSAGVTADSPAGALYVASTENNASVEVLLYQDGEQVRLGQFYIESVPDEAQLSATLEVSGMLSLDAGLYREERMDAEAQVVSLSLDAQGQKLDTSLVYGDKDEGTFAEFAMDIASQAALSFDIESAPNANGDAAGTFSLSAKTYADGSTVNVASNFVKTVGDVTFRTIANADDAIDAATASEEEAAQLSEEFNNVLSGLLGYLATLTPEVA